MVTQPAGTQPAGTRPAPARSDGSRQGFNLDSFLSSFQQGLTTAQQGWDFARQVPGIVQQFAAPGPPPAGTTPTGMPPGGDGPLPGSGSPITAPAYPLSPVPDAPAPPPPTTMSPAADTGQVDRLLQALRQGQIPALPGPYAAPAPVPAHAPPADAMAMLRLILSNPQFLSALHSTAASSTPRPVSLPVPVAAAAPRLRQVPIPLGAVLNAIVALAGASMTDLSAATREDEPEVPAYLVDAQGGFIVDPASADDRAALVTHFFRLSAEAQGASEGWLPVEQFEAFDESVDEGEATEAWDRGF